MIYNFTITVDDNGLIYIEEPSTLLQAVIVQKGNLELLKSTKYFENWQVAGCYILDHGNGRAYVGRSDSLIDRLESHERNKDFIRALLIRRSSFNNFSHSATEWLEESIFRELGEKGVLWSNTVAPKGWNMSLIDQQTLASFIPIIDSLSCILGIQFIKDTNHDNKFTLSSIQRKVEVIDLLTAGLVFSGQILYPPQGTNYSTAKILDDGKLSIDGQIFNYLSNACKSISNGNLRNGWKAWHIKDNDGKFISLDQLRQQLVGN